MRINYFMCNGEALSFQMIFLISLCAESMIFKKLKNQSNLNPIPVIGVNGNKGGATACIKLLQSSMERDEVLRTCMARLAPAYWYQPERRKVSKLNIYMQRLAAA